MKNKIRALYHAPFTVDHDYVYDARKEIVADFRGNNDSLRPRGWGRMQYMEDATALHDYCESFLIGLVRKFSSDQKKCIALLNTAWESEESFNTAWIISGVDK